jgi:hypothetical protein
VLIARQSTAKTVTVGPVLDADGVAVTDRTVSALKLSKNGAAPAALNGSATLTHRHTGHYSLALTATDLDSVGTAEVVIDDTVNACPMKEISVVEEAVYDALFADAATGLLPANVTQIDGLATSGNNATLNLKQLNVVNNAGTAIVATSTGSSGTGLALTGHSNGPGMSVTGGSGGSGITVIASGIGAGIAVTGGASGPGVRFSGGSGGAGLVLAGGSTNQAGLSVTGGGSGAAVSLTGGATGNGLTITGGSTSGSGIAVTVTSGAGVSLSTSDGEGLLIQSAGVGVSVTSDGTSAAEFVAAGNGHGISLIGAGAGSGLRGLGGASGHGLFLDGGVSGDDLHLAGSDAPTLAAIVNAEVLDVLNVDTFVQPTGVPTGTATLVEKIGRVHQMGISELTVTSSAKTYFTFGGAALWKQTLSDDGTTLTVADAAAP